ncbi:hypothetical protein HKK52_18005 [Pseudomonas sp. ADAK2]|uniref:contact-dependent growth inhibition system immunity protein n=1 Tax=Pseudomonas TaxID=286 RepID=UPI00146349EE|nr:MULTISPECIES: contact-dependent growth inhibition system immunity protein [unclassified Pseudomonas]QJI42754.1 hypothetical protein HKK53_18010 [Pseudomonas sp. ADAK7]QJI49057.1 hypothetical protein HKK52_18005 [Pseudomonas sp. ADAK2]
MNKTFPELHQFFGAYFHQDWTVEHETAEQVIDAFLADSDSEDLTIVRGEITALLNQGKDEMELRNYLLQELSCYYCYWNVWESGVSWLLHIADRLANGFDRH